MTDAALPAALARLLPQVRACRRCVTAPLGAPLPHEPRPILVASPVARLAVASQAPGFRAHNTGVPFHDPSGQRLREWMGIGPDLFYDSARVMILPMGFCFPGHDLAKGDLPPRPECRATWHDAVFDALPQVETILCIGLHAIRYHLGRRHPGVRDARSLTAIVADWRRIADAPGDPRLIPLPHPSWRNSGWLKRHPWFEAEVLPAVRAEVKRLVHTGAAPAAP